MSDFVGDSNAGWRTSGGTAFSRPRAEDRKDGESLEYWKGKALELQRHLADTERQLREITLEYERFKDETLSASWKSSNVLAASAAVPRPDQGSILSTSLSTAVSQILLLGFQGCGRTSLLVRLCCDELLPVTSTGEHDEISPVFTYEHQTFQIVSPRMSAFESVQHYTAPCAVVYLFDIRDDSSFQDLKDFYMEYTKPPGNLLEIVVGNFSDEMSEREVEASEALSWAANNNLFYVECSCKTGHKVDMILSQLIASGVPEGRHTRPLSTHMLACPMLAEVLAVKEELVRHRVIPALHMSSKMILRLSSSSSATDDVMTDDEMAKWESSLLEGLPEEPELNGSDQTPLPIISTPDGEVGAITSGIGLSASELGLSPIILGPRAVGGPLSPIAEMKTPVVDSFPPLPVTPIAGSFGEPLATLDSAFAQNPPILKPLTRTGAPIRPKSPAPLRPTPVLVAEEAEEHQLSQRPQKQIGQEAGPLPLRSISMVAQVLPDANGTILVPVIDKQEWSALLSAGDGSPSTSGPGSLAKSRSGAMVLARVAQRYRSIGEAVKVQAQQQQQSDQPAMGNRRGSMSRSDTINERKISANSSPRITAPSASSLPPTSPESNRPASNSKGSSLAPAAQIPGDVVLDTDGRVKQATPQQLVDLLATGMHLKVGEFLLTYRSFLTPSKLLSMLKDKFSSASHDSFVSGKILAVVRTWVEHFFWDFLDPSLSDEFLAFLRSVRSHDPSIDQGFKKTEGILLAKKAEWIPPTFPLVVAASVPLDYFDLDCLAFSPVEIAQQICLRDWKVFTVVPASEIIGRAWMKGKAPTIERFTAMFNALSGWVTMSLMLREKAKDRVRAFKRILAVAEKLKSLGNFHSLMAILAGLNSTPIYRLKATMEEIQANKKMAVTLAEMMSLTSIKGSYANLRQALKDRSPPLIPYLGMLLQDYNFIEEGNKDFVGDKVNFIKCRFFADTIRGIQTAQMTGYNFEPMADVQNALENLPLFDEGLADSLSLYLEPRTGSVQGPRPSIYDYKFASGSFWNDILSPKKESRRNVRSVNAKDQKLELDTGEGPQEGTLAEGLAVAKARAGTRSSSQAQLSLGVINSIAALTSAPVTTSSSSTLFSASSPATDSAPLNPNSSASPKPPRPAAPPPDRQQLAPTLDLPPIATTTPSSASSGGASPHSVDDVVQSKRFVAAHQHTGGGRAVAIGVRGMSNPNLIIPPPQQQQPGEEKK